MPPQINAKEQQSKPNQSKDHQALRPTREFAQAWATGEWQGCTPKAIPTADWFSRWTPGLEEDDLLVAVFPTEEDDGTILFPDEFQAQLSKSIRSTKF